MSEEHSEERPREGGGIPADPEASPPAAADPAQRQPASRRAALWLSGLVILIVAGVGLSPFWAPDVAPLLPWGAAPGPAGEDYAALAARVDAVEKRPVPPSVDAEATKSALGALGRRVEQIESTVNARLADIEKRPAPPAIDVDAIKSAESALARRVDQLEAAAAATKAGLQQFEQRLGAAETQSSSRAASAAPELQKIQQELSRLGIVAADLANRLPAVEQQMQSQSVAERTDAALAMVLLQIREAVDQARPFPAEYGVLKALARDPGLVASAEPLAEAAQSGVPSRAALTKRLSELAGQVAAATEPPPVSDWGAQALARLRALVMIRRIDGASQTGPEAAVSGAQAALARGDLAGAVAALDPLTGANAEAARPWLRMARERLAVETALDRLQQLLGARIGSNRAPPAAGPAEPAAKARAPS
jgi:hypothetical protein